MNCVLKEPIYKFVDRLILTDKVLEKRRRMAIILYKDERKTYLDRIAVFSPKQIYFAREISSTEHAEFSEACDQDKLYNHDIHPPTIHLKNRISI